MPDIWSLQPGVVYVVTKAFETSRGDRVAAGERLTFVGRNFVPYHGGHVLTFRERAIGFQEEDDAALIAALGDLLSVHDTTGRVKPPLFNWRELLGVGYCLPFIAAGGWMVHDGRHPLHRLDGPRRVRTRGRRYCR